MNNENITFEIPRFRYLTFTYSVGFLGLFILFNSFGVQNYLVTYFFSMVGVIIIFLAFMIYQTRDKGILITKDGIYEKNGKPICSFEEIVKVDTSPFAFKATNGFVINLKTKSKFDFSLGLWWRYNRRISIGGMISKSESRFLSLAIQGRLSGASF